MSKKARNTTEQLRLDHIETLHLLSEEKQKTAELEARLKELSLQRSPLDDSHTHTLSLSHTHAHHESAAGLADLVEQTRLQQAEIAGLKSQLQRVSLEERRRAQEQCAQQTADLSAKTLSLAKRERELVAEIAALRESLSLAQTAQESLSKAVDALRVCERERDRLALSLEEKNMEFTSSQNNHSLQVSALEREICDLRQSLEAVQQRETDCAACKEKEERIKLLQESLSSTLQSEELLKKELQRMIALVEEREEQLLKLQRELKTTATSEVATQTEPLANNDKQPSIAQDPPPAPTSSTKSSADNEETSFLPGSSRFQEFMRLKRENQELKLQLTHLTSSSSSSLSSSRTQRRSFDAQPPGVDMLYSQSQQYVRQQVPIKQATKLPQVAPTKPRR